MASVNSIVFDQAAYAPGATITATVDYATDTGTTTPTTYTFTADVTDTSGNVVATLSSDFVVDTPGGGDILSVSDSGGRVWSQSAPVTESDGSLQVAFTATA